MELQPRKVSVSAFIFGGFLAVFPTITGQFFGQKNLGANYGIIYQAHGIAALIGPIIKGNAADFNQTFLIAAGFAVIGMVISLLVKAPVQNIVTLETTQSKAV